MIENCKRFLIKGLKVHSKTLNVYTVESVCQKLEQIQKIQNLLWQLSFFQIGKIGVSIVTNPHLHQVKNCP